MMLAGEQVKVALPVALSWLNGQVKGRGNVVAPGKLSCSTSVPGSDGAGLDWVLAVFAVAATTPPAAAAAPTAVTTPLAPAPAAPVPAPESEPVGSAPVLGFGLNGFWLPLNWLTAGLFTVGLA